MKRLAPILAAATVVLGTGLAAHSATATTGAVTQPDGLNVTESSASHDAGTFTSSATTISFDATAVTSATADAEVTVAGKTFTVDRDHQSGKASWSGAKASLTPDDRDALVAFAAALITEWATPAIGSGAEVTDHRDLVIRLAELLAEAPLGEKIGTKSVPRPAETTTDMRVVPSGVPTVESCVEDALAEGATEAAAADACQRIDEDGIQYFGSSCATRYRTLCHDTAGHCFLCESVWSGPHSSACLGRCGPGCTGSPTYTYDCGDHDRCVRVHGGFPANPWDRNCGDEFWTADDDLLWGRWNCRGV